jgi:hypothetical protein
MRYLQVRLTGDQVLLHPLVPTLTDEECFREAKMIEWSPSFEPPRVTVLLYLEGDLDHFEDVLAETDIVLASDVTRFGDSRGYVYIHGEPHPTEWGLATAFSGEGLVPVLPIEYHYDGTISIRVLGPLERLQEAVERLPTGVDTAIEQVGEYNVGRPQIPPPLPDRQREALAVAFDAGYYDMPRTASRDEVADRLNCAPSTASEHLQKAERRLVKTYLHKTG